MIKRILIRLGIICSPTIRLNLVLMGEKSVFCKKYAKIYKKKGLIK